jgi:hypothetical protein
MADLYRVSSRRLQLGTAWHRSLHFQQDPFVRSWVLQVKDEQFHSHVLGSREEFRGGCGGVSAREYQVLCWPNRAPTLSIKKLKHDLDITHRMLSLLGVKALAINPVEQNCDVTGGMYWSCRWTYLYRQQTSSKNTVHGEHTLKHCSYHLMLIFFGAGV